VSAAPLPVVPRHRLLLISLAGVGALMGAGSVESPRLVLAGAAGLLFVGIALRSLPAGLAAFTVLIFLERIPSISGSGLTVTKAAGGVLGLAWLLALLKRNSDLPLLTRRHGVLAYAVLVLLCWTLASMLWAADADTARTTGVRFALGVLLIFVVFSAVREPRHLRWSVYAFVAGAVLSAFVGLAGITQADRADIYASGRLSGGISDPNELAAILLPALALVLFMLVIENRVLVRLLLVGAAVVCALALFRTESRGGLVGLAVMLAAGISLAGPVRARATIVALATSGFALAYFALIAPPQALARVTSFGAGGGTGRPDLWAVALDITRAHPLLGVGAGNFRVVEPSYAFRNRNLPRFDLIVDTPKVVHNMYLNILVELGLIGFILFAVLIVGAFIAAGRALRVFARVGDSEAEILARGLMVGTIGMLAAFFFLSAQYEKQLPLLLGLLVALSSLARPPRDVRRATPRDDLALVKRAARDQDRIRSLAPARGLGFASPATSTAPPAKLSLATATADQLKALPGIGPVTAQRIIAYRTSHGPLRWIGELGAVRGLGPARIARLRDLVAP
jgi:putative inorganic carbon (HCO3(-)) transporter